MQKVKKETYILPRVAKIMYLHLRLLGPRMRSAGASHSNFHRVHYCPCGMPYRVRLTLATQDLSGPAECVCTQRRNEC